jgi:hypothetical protein
MESLKIVSIIVVRSTSGADHIGLETDIPDPMSPDETLVFTAIAPRHTGIAFCQKHFPGIPVTERDYTTKRTKFSGEKKT